MKQNNKLKRKKSRPRVRVWGNSNSKTKKTYLIKKIKNKKNLTRLKFSARAKVSSCGLVPSCDFVRSCKLDTYPSSTALIFITCYKFSKTVV